MIRKRSLLLIPILMLSCTGPQGETGAQGLTGPRGPQGEPSDVVISENSFKFAGLYKPVTNYEPIKYPNKSSLDSTALFLGSDGSFDIFRVDTTGLYISTITGTFSWSNDEITPFLSFRFHNDENDYTSVYLFRSTCLLYRLGKKLFDTDSIPIREVEWNEKL